MPKLDGTLWNMGLRENGAAAKRAGANIVKFQYWNPKRLKSGVWIQMVVVNNESAQLTEEKISELISSVIKKVSNF